MKHLKILHILDHSLPLHSGYTFRSQNIFRAQRRRGWEPVILTSSKHEQSWKGSRKQREEIGGFTYYRTGPTPEGKFPFEYEFRLMKALGARILEVAAVEKPDLIHAHSPVLNAIPALWLRRRLGIPVVYEIRAFWEDAAVDHGSYAENSAKYRIVRFLETQVCRKADQVGVLCSGLKNDLMQRGIAADKMTPVFNAVNLENFNPCPPDDEFVREWGLAGKKVVAFIGSFYRYEGLDLLVEAFSEVARKQKDSVLLLVGGGEVEKELRVQIASLQIEDRVVMPGRIPHERIAGVYALVDVLAYPRHSMRLTDLVTPLKPLEAMAMGKAFIASDVGGHLELIRHQETGYLFPAGDSKALADGIEVLLTDDVLRNRLEADGLEWVRNHHTWEKTTAVYPEIYEKALRRGGDDGNE